MTLAELIEALMLGRGAPPMPAEMGSVPKQPSLEKGINGAMPARTGPMRAPQTPIIGRRG